VLVQVNGGPMQATCDRSMLSHASNQV